MNMKKSLSLLLVMALIMSLAVGCAKAEDKPEEVEVEETEGSESEETVAEGNIAKVGLGQVISAKGNDKEEEKNASGQVDVTVAAVGFDDEDKVASVSIDVVQGKVEFDEEGKFVTDIKEELKSKKELSEDYGMKKNSEIEKEWDEQIVALEEWMIGKTVDEITGLKVKEVDENHVSVPDVEELTSSVTITVESYLEAVKLAFDNAVEVEGAEAVGLGLEKGLAKSSELDEENSKLPKLQMDLTSSAVAFDGEGKVVKAIIDTVQGKVEFDEEGKVTSDLTADILTKKELSEDYGMKKNSEIEKEWDEQIIALEEWMVGKTVDEITRLKVKEVDENHVSVPDVEELTSSVTITVESYLGAVANAYEDIK